jgi:60 kDa SS-A/Ro ribonucleoprotein
MPNTQLFKTSRKPLPPVADTYNEAGGAAYKLEDKHQLAQLAATGCLYETFYSVYPQEQLHTVLELAQKVDPTFIARTAIYARQSGAMKDMPALLMSILAVRDVKLCAQVFDRVIDNGKMLRNFVQIMRSGTAGRKSLGTRPKKLIQNWLQNANEKQLLNAAVGNTPSLADVVKMVHPKAEQDWRNAWFAWLIGKPCDDAALPPITQTFERFKREREQLVKDGAKMPEMPDVPFQMLTALELGTAQWAQIARTGSWQMVRQNLNTFARHGVFGVEGMSKLIADKLRNSRDIAKSRVFPYQLMMAFKACAQTVPDEVKLALQDAMDIALANVPDFGGKVVVCPDVSGSMSSPVTGGRGSATTNVRCIDVAALVAAAVLHKNQTAHVLPFEEKVVTKLKLNPRDSVMTNANALASIGGGGTNCSAPLAKLNHEKTKVDLVILVSDNESWVDSRRAGATATMSEWQKLKKSNPDAKLVCIDIQPYTTTQAKENKDIFNIGGFSDAVFTMINYFAQGKTEAGHWVKEIEKIDLDPASVKS